MPELIALPDVSYSPAQGVEISMRSMALGLEERLVLFGPNGAGKTTLLRLLAGTLAATSPLPRSSYLQQRPYMFRGTARHNLRLGLTGAEIDHAEQLAEDLGVARRLESAASSLSGGERQRLALARALARSADLLLLDEPLSAIDVRQRELVTGILASETRHRSSVIVTHDREVAAVLADRVAVIVDGTIRQIGSVDEVFTLPVDDEVALTVGLGNVLSGVVVDVDDPLVAVEVDGIRVWALGAQDPGTAVKVLFGAETVTVHTGGQSQTSARNSWSGRLATVRPVGRLVELLVDVGPRVVALITPGSLDALGLQAGSEVGLSLKATAARAVYGPES